MKKRAFIAIDIPNKITDEIGELEKKLEKLEIPAKFIAPKTLHITLKFLGFIEDNEIDLVTQVLEREVPKFEPFRLSLGQVCLIPDSKWARVVAIEAEEDEELLYLQRKLVEELDKLPFVSVFTRKFKPHVTIGRLKKGSLGFRRNDELKYYNLDLSFQVKEIKLKESELFQEGARYKDIKIVPLQEK